MFKIGDIVYLKDTEVFRYTGFGRVVKGDELEIVIMPDFGYNYGVRFHKSIDDGHSLHGFLSDTSGQWIRECDLEYRNIDFCECTNEKLFKVGCGCGFLTRILKKVGKVG